MTNKTAAQAALDEATQQIQAVINDPSASYWIKDALRQAINRDPLDAEADTDRLALLIHNWSVAIMRVATNDGARIGKIVCCGNYVAKGGTCPACLDTVS